MQTVRCGMWDLVPWPGIEPRPPALGAWSLSHCTAREVPGPCIYLFLLLYLAQFVLLRSGFFFFLTKKFSFALRLIPVSDLLSKIASMYRVLSMWQVTLLLVFSHSVVLDSLQPRGLQHARPPCPSLSPRVCPSSHPLSRWCHPTILSYAALFSFAFNLSQKKITRVMQ